MKVKEIMTSDVITVLKDSMIEETAQLLTHHRLRGLPCQPDPADGHTLNMPGLRRTGLRCHAPKSGLTQEVLPLGV